MSVYRKSEADSASRQRVNCHHGLQREKSRNVLHSRAKYSGRRARRMCDAVMWLLQMRNAHKTKRKGAGTGRHGRACWKRWLSLARGVIRGGKARLRSGAQEITHPRLIRSEASDLHVSPLISEETNSQMSSGEPTSVISGIVHLRSNAFSLAVSVDVFGSSVVRPCRPCSEQS